MMIQEFTARTNVTPSSEEYHYIEQSYYDFDGNKDEFCKQWLKDMENGKWALEFRLRKAQEKLDRLNKRIIAMTKIMEE